MKKKLFLIILGILSLISITVLFILWRAFGPIHSSGNLKISDQLEIQYEETYIGDYSSEIYTIKFKNKDKNIGSHTFNNMNWSQHYFTDSLLDRTFIFMADSSLGNRILNGYYLISFEKDFQNTIDTFYYGFEVFNHQNKMKDIIELNNTQKKIDNLNQKVTFILKVSNNIQDQEINEYLSKELIPIRKNFKRINSILKWTHIEHIDLYELTEGGQAEYYYKKETLEKIIVRHFGEMGQILKEYYLNQHELSFVFEKTYEYNRPIYWDSTRMNEAGDNEVFDFETAEIIEDRSYFIKNELIHQINNQDCGSPFSDDYLKQEQERILDEFKRLLELKQ